MLLNDDTVDLKKSDGICSPTFFVDEFPEFLKHPSIFSFKHSRSALIITYALSDFWF